MGQIVARFVMPHAPILIEDIGMGSEKQAILTIKGMERIADRISKLDFDTVLIITPHGYSAGDSHTIINMEHAQGDFREFGNFNLSYGFDINKSLTNRILEYSESEGFKLMEITKKQLSDYELPSILDHGCLVPLHFINKSGKKYDLVDISYGLSSYSDIIKFGKLLNKAIEYGDENVLVIASGDLSHKASNSSPYGFDSRGLAFDKEFRKILSNGKTMELLDMDRAILDYSYECGFRSILMMLGTLKGDSFDFKEFSYEHPFGIGYMTAEIL
jgi:aromatic ring-opening dioxygenase LigB subunit